MTDEIHLTIHRSAQEIGANFIETEFDDFRLLLDACFQFDSQH